MVKKLIIVVMLLSITACATLQQELKKYIKQPEVTYKSISVGKISKDLLELNPIFNITNKNSFAIPIDAVSYELSLNNKKMLAGETNKIGSLAANKTKQVTIPLALTQETLSAFQTLLLKNKRLDYQIKGSVEAMGLVIPFTKSDTLYVPEIKIKGLKVINASFSQLDIQLSVDVDNKNDFSLPLESLNYSVSTGGNILFKGSLKNHKIGLGKSNLQIPLSIKPDYLFSSLFSLLASPKVPLHFEISSPLFTKSYDQTLDLGSLF